MKPVAWIVLIFVAVYCILTLIPAWHECIYNATQNLDAPLRILIRFFLDPLEYVWKWILGLLIVTFLYFRRDA